jgi:hypothetical protein
MSEIPAVIDEHENWGAGFDLICCAPDLIYNRLNKRWS